MPKHFGDIFVRNGRGRFIVFKLLFHSVGDVGQNVSKDNFYVTENIGGVFADFRLGGVYPYLAVAVFIFGSGRNKKGVWQKRQNVAGY